VIFLNLCWPVDFAAAADLMSPWLASLMRWWSRFEATTVSIISQLKEDFMLSLGQVRQQFFKYLDQT